MAITAKNKPFTDFPPLTGGLQAAVLYGIYDIGTHWEEHFGINSHKVILLWELPNEPKIEITKDDSTYSLSRVISHRFTKSLSKKSSLRAFLISWRGRDFTEEELKGFDLLKLLGQNCMVNISVTKKDDGKYKTDVTLAAKLIAGMPILKPENKLQYFSFEEPGCQIPDVCPGWIKELIFSSHEWMETHKGEQEAMPISSSAAVPPEDDVPF